MKVIEVSSTFPPHIGGVETHVHLLSRHLLEKGFDLEVFTTSPNTRRVTHDCVDGIPVTRFPSIAPFDTIYFSPAMTRALREVDADLVHAHGYRSLPMLSVALANRKNRFRFFITTHLGFSKLGRMPYVLYNPTFGQMILRRAERILLVSRQEPSLLPILRAYAEKVEIIPNGIEIADVSFEETYRQKMADGLRLLYVGRLEKKKGIDTAIDVLARIPDSDVKLDIVGVGGYADHLTSRIERLGLGDRVRFHGRVDFDVLSGLYRRSHVLLLLSQYESFPMTIIEAMNAGVVPIATGVGDVPHAIGEKAGFVVDYPVDERIAARHIRNLSAQRETLRCMAREGWSRVRDKFDMRNIASKIGCLYLNSQRNVTK